MRAREVHNLDAIAWRAVPAGEPTTLAYFMRDYVGHLEHHLRQVLGDAAVEGIDSATRQVVAGLVAEAAAQGSS